MRCDNWEPRFGSHAHHGEEEPLGADLVYAGRLPDTLAKTLAAESRYDDYYEETGDAPLGCNNV